jgi:peptidoglycan lytic transglycosylase G
MPSDLHQWDQDRRYQGGSQRGAHRDFAVLPRSPSEALEPDHAPEPPPGRKVRREHPFLAFMHNMMTLMFVGVIGLTALFYFVRMQFDQPGPLGYATVVVIPRGEGMSAIADRLEREGVIADRRIFVASALYFRAQDKLKAGEYAIKKNASIREVLDTLVEGKAILYSVSLPEGLTSMQIVDRLNNNPELTGSTAVIPPEGSLLPDTYRFARGTRRDELVARMQDEQTKFIDKIWATRAAGLPVKTKQEAVTLASIVEKETGRADERPRVAAVYVNRLKANMRLESDPTIIYGLSGGKGTLGRGILRSELEQMTPYNTYRIKGLPPTPIANPGRPAIEAVLRPAKTSELFFVADGTGGHVFAEKYEDHQKNVAKWRIVEREQRAKDEAEAAAAATTATTAATGAGQASAVVPGVAVTSAANEAAENDNTGEVPLPTRKPKK